MSSLRLRALIAAGVLIGIGAPLAAAPGASAHNCAKVTIYRNDGGTPVGSCHAPGSPGPGDICAPGGLVPLGYGATWQVCVLPPVLLP